MIELPEALTIASQMNETLRGKRIHGVVCGGSPHKFAFYNHPMEDYATLLTGRSFGEAVGHGPFILAAIEPGYDLVLGDGGERIVFHQTKETLPKKHQLFLEFDDTTSLTVSVQGWGFIHLVERTELPSHPHVKLDALSPLSDDFTFEYFGGLFSGLKGGDSRSIKAFVISNPGILGVGNGYLQDILFLARLHPRQRVIDTEQGQRYQLYEAIRTVLKEAAEKGGRDTEHDLFNRPGGYRKILDSRAVDQPCPACGTPIEKTTHLGGTSYFCRQCQK